ncbi:ABC transporter permease [Listeria sp. PSOL-1]|uniref:ABC transporter permease n=1 Tax=Listeria sp. PSOL-1 TaxID=1844999 RepID=UPI00351B1D1A
MGKRLFSKTGELIQFNFRRNRLGLVVWLVALIAVSVLIAQAFQSAFSTSLERASMAETMKNPAMIAMVGPATGASHYTVGAMMGQQMLLFTAIVVAIMNILIVTRSTRANEEDGGLELIHSLPVGRLANLLSTMLTMLFVNILLALGTGFGLTLLGISSLDLNGSLLYGMCLGGTGFFFAAVTALFAQLCESSRGTVSFSLLILGLSYLVRAVGDVSHEMLSWFSPLGWILKVEVYVNNYWAPILLVISTAIIISLAACYLSSIRDLAAGYLPTFSGRKQATSWLLSPFGLVLRLQRTALISWFLGLVVLGASYGSVFGNLESFFKDNALVKQLLSSGSHLSFTEQFVATLMSILAIISAIPALMLVLKMKSEERKNRMEHLLTRAISRFKVMFSYLIFAILISFIMLFAAVLGFTCSDDKSNCFSYLF